MKLRIGNIEGCALLLGVLFGPGLIAASVTGQGRWLILAPAGTVAVLLGIAALPVGRKVPPQKYADELERHLLGMEGEYDWDRTSGVRLSDQRLEHLRRSLPASFDTLPTTEDRMELKRIIDALRRGEYDSDRVS